MNRVVSKSNENICKPNLLFDTLNWNGYIHSSIILIIPPGQVQLYFGKGFIFQAKM